MCGICGYITKYELPANTIESMNNSMIHRGPDDSGSSFWADSGWNFALGHRRLSILDLSILGHQPMASADGNIEVVFNGEIYNYLEIKSILQKKGYNFTTQCDTEIIIYSYIEWGSKMVSLFNGMFAIAILNKQECSLTLFRDRLGKKPLYYYCQNSDFVFSSELKPLMQYPQFNKQINEDILMRFLFYQYINDPETIFKNVYKLKPGYALEWKNGEMNEWCYWDAIKQKDQNMNAFQDYSEAKLELSKILEDSVRLRMISDVPLGVFLSGGIDSTLVSAFAQSISDKPINTFCIGFFEKDFNEAGYAKDISRFLGTNHHELYIDENYMLNLIDDIPEYYDEPFADSSQIPTMAVSKLAKGNVTVALSGDGGDELFCGYNKYDKINMIQKIYKYKNLTRLTCDFMSLFSQEFLNGRVFRFSNHLKGLYSLESAIQSGLESVEKEKLSSLLINKQMPLTYKINYQYPNLQESKMLLDILTYLPGDILTKVDRASMKYSLETRCPLLDYRLVEFSFALPHVFMYRNGVKKAILKDVLYDVVPRKLLDRPKKGFSPPVDKWLRGVLKEKVLFYLSSGYINNQGLFHASNVNILLHQYYDSSSGGGYSNLNSRILWSMLMFQMWYEKWIK